MIALGARKNDRGALSLSYIIIMPVFLAALMLIVQASVWYLAREAALAAARHGVDVARARGGTTGAGTGAALGAGTRAAVQFVHSAAQGYLLTPNASPDGSNARTVRITVTGGVPVIFPGFGLTVTQSAQAPVEQFTTP